MRVKYGPDYTNKLQKKNLRKYNQIPSESYQNYLTETEKQHQVSDESITSVFEIVSHNSIKIH
jgi:hypothetical protein